MCGKPLKSVNNHGRRTIIRRLHVNIIFAYEFDLFNVPLRLIKLRILTRTSFRKIKPNSHLEVLVETFVDHELGTFEVHGKHALALVVQILDGAGVGWVPRCWR